MKFSLFNIFILTAIISFSGIHAQNRGFKPIELDVDGTAITLYEQSHALVIGVSDYKKTGWSELRGVKNDIRSVKETLEKHDFSVRIIEDPTSKELKSAFDQFISDYGHDYNNRLLVYFSGHGFTLKQGWGGELGYIVPSDAPDPGMDSRGFKDKAINMEMMEVYAKRINAKHVLFMFDCCFAGTIFSITRSAPPIITYKTREAVRQFITAGSADEEVPDASIFCREFIKGLGGDADANKDGYATGSELGSFLQTNVTNYSKDSQHPQYGKLRNDKLDKGDFVFVINEPLEPIPPAISTNDETIGSALADSKNNKPKDQHRGNRKTGTFNSGKPYKKPVDVKLLPDNWEPEMAFVKGGYFMMGSQAGAPDEAPVHNVFLDDYMIGKFEVTQIEWQHIMKSNPSSFSNCDSCPVERVSYYDVQKFIKKLNQLTGKKFRLPTEAEWEYAAREGVYNKSFQFSGSSNLYEVGWYKSNSGNITHPVGQLKPNRLGIYDMSGNVWEWCSDRYDRSYYSKSPKKNPTGSRSGYAHVNRGGGYNDGPNDCKASNRDLFSTTKSSANLGFRLALDLN